ncbi:MAG: hypothetical protein QNJ05_12870 [Woeseiaceae bacterium]|nr:hypothetical protein [Woeseiaceae bacterium]
MTASIREPQFRLLLSMAPAVVLVALLLQALAMIIYSQVAPTVIHMEKARPLNVLLSYAERQQAPSAGARQPMAVEDEPEVQRSEREAPRPSPDDATRTPIDVVETIRETTATSADDALEEAEAPELETTIDWHAEARETAVGYLEDRSAADARREARWRTSGSVLFKPGEEKPLELDGQILPSYHFRDPVGVVGLGLSFGQCFIGIPLIGIAVEDRTPGVGLIYCRD